MGAVGICLVALTGLTGLTMSTPPGSSEPENAIPAAGEALAGLVVVGEPPAIPAATRGMVEVVMQGPGSGSIAPVVVRNGADHIVYNVRVTGIARDAAGALAATGQSQEMVPIAVEPGAIAVGYVYFEAGLDVAEILDYEVAFDAEEPLPALESPTVIEANLAASGDVVGLVENGSASPLEYATVGHACFGEAGLLYAYWGSLEVDVLAPGESAGFTLPGDPDCTSAVVGSGHLTT